MNDPKEIAKHQNVELRWIERAEALAKRLGIEIPPDSPIQFWHLGIMEKLLDRIEELEAARRTLH